MAYTDYTSRSEAAALISAELEKTIYAELPQQSAALSLMKTVKMGKTTTSIPVAAALPIAQFLNGDNTPTSSISNVSWTGKTLTAESLMVIVPIPKAMIQDADYDVVAELKPAIFGAMGKALDAAIFWGTGKPSTFADAMYTSWSGAASGNMVSAASATLSALDASRQINYIMGLPEAQGFVINGFAAAPTMKASLRGLRDTTGGLILQPSLVAGTPATLYGENIFYVSNGAWDATKGTLIAGDWNQGIIGLRQDVTIDIVTEGVISDGSGAVQTNLMQSDMVAIKAVMRVGWQVANPVTALNATSARYPWAFLQV